MTLKILFLTVTTNLLMTLPAFGSDSCVHLSGTYPQCTVVRSIDPEVEDKFSDVKILNSSDTEFTIDMMIDGEPTTSSVIADGKEYTVAGEEKPFKIRTLCEDNALIVSTKEDFMGTELQGEFSYSKKDGVLTITQFLLDKEWQITTCQ